MNEKLKKLAEELEEEFGEVAKPIESEEEEMYWKYPRADSGEVVIAMNWDRETGDVFVGLIDDTGMKIHRIDAIDDNAGGIMMNAISGKVIHGMSEDLKGVMDMIQTNVPLVAVDEEIARIIKKTPNQIRSFLPIWAKNRRKNAFRAVFGRLLLAYYLYTLYKYEPKNNIPEKYKVQVNI